jgi:hypothetical protein
MAEREDPHRVEKIRPGARAVYPWASWTDGEWWRLYQGADYPTTTQVFQSVARNYARRHGMRLETQLTEDGTFIRLTKKEAK